MSENRILIKPMSASFGVAKVLTQAIRDFEYVILDKDTALQMAEYLAEQITAQFPGVHFNIPNHFLFHHITHLSHFGETIIPDDIIDKHCKGHYFSSLAIAPEGGRIPLTLASCLIEYLEELNHKKYIWKGVIHTDTEHPHLHLVLCNLKAVEPVSYTEEGILEVIGGISSAK